MNRTIHRHMTLYPLLVSKYMYPIFDDTEVQVESHISVYYQIMKLMFDEGKGLSHLMIPFIRKYHGIDEFQDSVRLLSNDQRRIMRAIYYLVGIENHLAPIEAAQHSLYFPHFLTIVPKSSSIFRNPSYLELYPKLKEIRKIFGVHLYVTTKDVKQKLYPNVVNSINEYNGMLSNMFRICAEVSSYLEKSNIQYALGGSFSLYLQKKNRCSNDIDFVLLETQSAKEIGNIISYMSENVQCKLGYQDEYGLSFSSDLWNISIDMDITQHYCQPLRLPITKSMVKIEDNELPVLSYWDIFCFKKKYGRLKDLSSIYASLNRKDFVSFMS
ncbi:hypothetical protein ACFOQM_04495 [Paenibacillus sp. GCM10012307]|uniref:Nucleotidyltransferase family protein n=1 Tax=Paenibacillus roseus TaxID=2798579 RepID=A0A934J0N5_9BACL|nr:hypothetical protein [Paenibacillus roseus]MBJ6360570.1 hypothetical protein [Paenibacillus roseus]